MKIWQRVVRKSGFGSFHWLREASPDILRRPLSWLAVLGGASVLIGLMVGQQGWVLFGVCLSLGGIGIFGPWIQATSMDASLDWSKPRVAEGESVEVVLRIRNRLPVPLWGLKLSGLDGLSEQTCLSRVGAWGESEFRWEVSAGFRGRYPSAPPELRTGFPFGFIEMSAPVGMRAELLVHPRLSTFAHGISPAGRAFESHQSRTCQASLSGQFRQLRQYRPGDLLKLCDWKQTARTGDLVVRENENPTSQMVHVFLDLSDANSTDSVRVEVLLRATLMAVRDLLRCGQVVRCTLSDRTWNLDGKRTAFRNFLDEACDWRFSGDSIGDRPNRPRGRLIVPVLQEEAIDIGVKQRRLQPVQPFLPPDYRARNNVDEIPRIVFVEAATARQSSIGSTVSVTGKELSCA